MRFKAACVVRSLKSLRQRSVACSGVWAGNMATVSKLNDKQRHGAVP